MAVRFEGGVYVFEFMVAPPPGAALAQIKERGYADKYIGTERPVWQVGVEFSSKSRNVERFEVERLQ